MQPYTVFVFEKLATLKMVAPLLSAHWAGPRFAVTLNYLGHYEFRYPRGLGMSAFPFIGEPQWKPRHPSNGQFSAFSIADSGAQPCDRTVQDLLEGAASIVFAADPDRSGVNAFHVLLEQCLGFDQAMTGRPAIMLYALDPASVGKALNEVGSTHDDWFVALRNAGVARKFFDFNYNTNSLVIFGQVLRQLDSVPSSFQLSKYGLQLLYSLRDKPALNESSVMRRMHNWAGTGRYVPSQLGSAASQHSILLGAVEAGLIENSDGFALSPSGHALLNHLHPDCQDLDLPARLEKWESEWPASKPKIERYLRTVFGKQKRFARAQTPKL